eukprot:525415-Pleurochrysis_carterae.AAC.6
MSRANARGVAIGFVCFSCQCALAPAQVRACSRASARLLPRKCALASFEVRAAVWAGSGAASAAH